MPVCPIPDMIRMISLFPIQIRREFSIVFCNNDPGVDCLNVFPNIEIISVDINGQKIDLSCESCLME